MSAGRKRAFDKSVALDRAMRVFWEHGYSATSMSDLTEALGINKPSLYAAFGNKEQLFASALEHYLSHYGSPLLQRLTQPEQAPLAERIRAYMLGVIDLVTSKKHPKGCLLVKTSCEAGGSAIPEDVKQSLLAMRQTNEQVLCKFLENEQKKGHLGSSVSAKETAVYLMSVNYGLSVQARQGRSRRELTKVVDLAISALQLCTEKEKSPQMNANRCK